MYWDFRRQGKFLESVQALRKAVPHWDTSPRLMSEVDALESAYAARGRTGYLRQCLKVHKYYSRPAMYLAADYAELGDKENALEWLTRSYQNHELEALFLRTLPEFDSLRSDPRFQRLIRAIGFPQ
jgi:hypothetical protein